MENTIGGQDLSVFYIAELPDIQSLKQGIPLELCPMKLIMLEWEGLVHVNYSTLREKFPVRSLGMINAKDYTYGIRTISGTLGFAIFTEDPLSKLRSNFKKYINNALSGVSKGTKYDGTKPKMPNPADEKFKGTEGRKLFTSEYKKYLSEKTLYDVNQTQEAAKGTIFDEAEFKTLLLDQLPMFHILVMGVNERGNVCQFLIKYVTIIDESQYQGTAQPNIINKVSYVALDMIPITSKQFSNVVNTGSLSAIQEMNNQGYADYTKGNAKETTGSSELMQMRLNEIASTGRNEVQNGSMFGYNGGSK
jgi:hypothetical protein